MTEVKHFCKSSQGFHTLLLVFWPIPPCRSPLEQWCFGAVAGQQTFNSLQRFSMGLRSGDWLGHSRTLKCFLRSHSFKTLNLTIHGPIHSFLYTDQSSWSLCRKRAPKHDVSTPMLHSRYGVLWMQLGIQFLPKSYILVSSDLLPIFFWIIQMLSSKLQTGLDMYWLKQGDTSGTAGFESLAA